MSIEVLSFPSLNHAWDAYATIDEDVLVDIDGEAFEANGSQRRARLVDSGPRQRGERCYQCGVRRPHDDAGFRTSDSRWLCSPGCRIDHHDQFAELRGSASNEGDES